MKKKILFLLSLCMVTSIAFASATYAWFSDQFNPSIENLNFTVATQDYMVVSTSGIPGTFKDNISFSDLVSDAITLKPVEGHVSENAITITKDGNPTSNDYINFTLYFSASNDMDLYLAGSKDGVILTVREIIEDVMTEEQVENVSNALRIGFLAYHLVETPDSGGSIQKEHIPYYTNVYSKTQRANSDYTNNVKPYETYSTLGYKEGVLDDTAILNVKNLKVSKMDVYIWLEGNDKACNEQVYGVNLSVNLRFESVMLDEEGEE